MIAPPLNQRHDGGKTALVLHATGQSTWQGLHTFLLEADFWNSAVDRCEPPDERTEKHFPWLLTLSAWCAIRCSAKSHAGVAEASIRVLAISNARGSETIHFNSGLTAHLASTTHARAAGLDLSRRPLCGIMARDMPPNLRELAFPDVSGGLS